MAKKMFTQEFIIKYLGLHGEHFFHLLLSVSRSFDPETTPVCGT